MFDISDSSLAALVGFGSGLVLGLAARIARFCTLGAIEDVIYGDSRERLLMWPVALSVAIASTFGLAALGAVAIEEAVYLRLEFNLFAAVAGGLVFGLGMALAGNCGFGALARLGGGDLRSLIIVMVIGISAYMTAIGPLADLRLALFPRTEVSGGDIPGLAPLFGDALGLPQLAIALPVAGLLLALALVDASFRRNGTLLFWSAMVGLAITAGWWGTSWIAATGFDLVRIETHSFTMPLGEGLIQLMTTDGQEVGFSIGSVTGVLTGASIGALWRGHFRWEACDDPRELRRQIGGAFLMGVGGVVALGCSVGQGLAAFSVLAISAPVTIAAIGLGAFIGLRFLVEGSTILDAAISRLGLFAQLFRGARGR